jgi:hypothetical protein
MKKYNRSETSYCHNVISGYHNNELYQALASQVEVKVKLMLRPTVSRRVFLGVKHPSGAQDQIFITVRQLQVFWCGAPALTRGRVCRLQLLPVLDSAVILAIESHGAHDHILLSVSRFLQPERQSRRMYIPQENGGPVVPPGNELSVNKLRKSKLCSGSQTSDQDFGSVYRVYYVSTDNILMWICEV